MSDKNNQIQNESIYLEILQNFVGFVKSDVAHHRFQYMTGFVKDCVLFLSPTLEEDNLHKVIRPAQKELLSIEGSDISHATGIVLEVYQRQQGMLFSVSALKDQDKSGPATLTLYNAGEENWPQIVTSVKSALDIAAIGYGKVAAKGKASTPAEQSADRRRELLSVFSDVFANKAAKDFIEVPHFPMMGSCVGIRFDARSEVLRHMQEIRQLGAVVTASQFIEMGADAHFLVVSRLDWDEAKLPTPISLKEAGIQREETCSKIRSQMHSSPNKTGSTQAPIL